jgi:hypothetical protein
MASSDDHRQEWQDLEDRKDAFVQLEHCRRLTCAVDVHVVDVANVTCQSHALSFSSLIVFNRLNRWFVVR